MSNHQQPAPRTTEDLHFRLVGAPIETYPDQADGPVDYVEVVSERSGVLGYLWASPTRDAAGFVERPDAGDTGINESISWIRDLRVARAQQIPAADLLDALCRANLPLDPNAWHNGHPDPTSRATASSLQVLHSIANT